MTTIASDTRPQSYRFVGTMTALSSITHFGDSIGGFEQVLRREKIIQPDGSVIAVPVISGNGWRGALRDCGMRAMLEKLAIELNVETVHLPINAFYLLFSGGALSKEAGRGVDLGYARKLRALIPLLSVFGGAISRQILEGKLSIGKIVPICAETAHTLPKEQQMHPHASLSIYERLDMEHYTRQDDAKRESLASRYLPPPDLTLLDTPHAARKVTNKRTGEVEEIAEAPGVAQQMRYGFETLSAGTIFTCSISLRSVTPLEFEAFMTALREWSREPVIGGKSSIGLGRVGLEFPGWMVANPLLRTDEGDQAVGQPFGTLYQEHLHDHGKEIVEALEALG